MPNASNISRPNYLSKPIRKKGGNDEFYKSQAWKKLQKRVMIEEPFCECGKPTREIDHKIPIKVNHKLKLERKNLQGLCYGCHRKKTARDKKKYKL